MAGNPIQEFLSQFRIPFLGDNLLRKYISEKSPLREELLSTSQLEEYATTLAKSHVIGIVPGSEPLIRRLNENEEILAEVRQLLIASARENNPIPPAGEWLLDNFYLIEEQIHTGRQHFPKGYSDTLPKLLKGPLSGLPRVYHIAIELIAHSDGRVDPDNLTAFVQAYQKASPLNLGELWAIPIMLRMALIENLRRLAAQMALNRINNNLADTWADRMIDIAEKDPKSLIVATADMARSNPPMTSSFVAEITRRLLGKGPALTLPLTWIEQRLAENGLTTNGLILEETQKKAAAQVSMSNNISSLRMLNSMDWRAFVENTSLVEKILRRDEVYSRMDFQTRDVYRHKIEAFAKLSNRSEKEVASRVFALTKKRGEDPSLNARLRHVGYYLIDKGLRETEQTLGIRYPWFASLKRSLYGSPLLIYVGSILIISICLSFLLVLRVRAEGLSMGWMIVIAVVALIIMSQLAIAVVNWLSTILVKPDFLPRMNYETAIPPESKTLVVVPTMIGSQAEIEALLETMEVRYLANRQDHLHYALLTDFRDASTEKREGEDTMLAFAQQRVDELNEKYRHEAYDIFFLFHRPRRWNEVDQTWMGHERKRGKLADLMDLLRGSGKEKFQTIVGDISVLQEAKYILTLDTDTQLPRDAAWKIIATMAHPLNQAWFDQKKNRIVEGYGILQPRLATSISPDVTSWFARIHASEPGIDPYTRTVSDVYQDLLKEGSYTGKGIIDIDAFRQVLHDRMPENRILSHDLLEGCHARSGLVSDVQLYEDYPAAYLADMRRRHRWIRGDWQIARWLFPKVPDAQGHDQHNPISALSLWKISDNLRRSLVAPALLSMFLFGWLISPDPWFWMMIAVVTLLPAPLLALLYSVITKRKEVPQLHHTVTALEAFVTHVLGQIWTIVSLPYEALVNLDAILRTLWRVLVSHKNLLQWDPSNTTNGLKNIRAHFMEMWEGPALGIGMIITLSILSVSTLILSSPVLILWITSPLLAWLISLPQTARQASLSASQLVYLRKLSRRTWAYFDRFIGPEDHWLPPDNIQEYPSAKTAHRTSPTNIGVTLLSYLAAFDFGYIGTSEFIDRCQKTFATIQLLDRFKDHLFNWYDTITLAPLHPRYVSTVDSGNFIACLLTLKEGLLSIKESQGQTPNRLQGLEDTLSILMDFEGVPQSFKKLRHELQSALIQGADSSPLIRHYAEQILAAAEAVSQPQTSTSDELHSWIESLVRQCKGILSELEDKTPKQWKEQEDKLEELVEKCLAWSSCDFDFLFDKNQHHLSIGYNREEHRRDNGAYDLLGSEARLGIFVAIAQGKIPQESWFALGRQLTNSGTDPVLISWSGSMFEYLMPMLLMPTYENTLLSQSQKGAVNRQIAYGRNQDLPWGISESCFNMFHANLDYQYRAFGVPGLGLKRGLSNDYVVAPYASILALMVAPVEAIANLKLIAEEGGMGRWGFYEAIDYTRSRLQRDQRAVVVKAFMTHHQGMSFLSLSSILNGQKMQQRFQSDLHMQTSLLLLQEKIPVVSSYYTPADDPGIVPTESVHDEKFILHTPHTPIPEVQLLSNGRYHVMISNGGAGYSRWKDLMINRWREDGTTEPWGNFCFIKELESGACWSPTYQPTLTEPDRYEVIFGHGRAEFRRRDNQIESHMEIVVSPEDDVELRRLHLTNRSRKKRIIEVTSYAEVVLNQGIAEVLHPAFSNLFVQTHIHADRHAILCTRRPRSPEEKTVWFFHLAKTHGGEIQNVAYETSRESFIGRRNSIHTPKAVFQSGGLNGNEGSVLDPIVAIQYQIQLMPLETVTVDMIFGIGETEATANELVNKYQDKPMTDRAFELAWTHGQVILRQINATASDALLYSRLAGSIIYANASLRAEAGVIMKNQRSQSGLWSHSISGDWPIVLLQIEDATNIDLVQQLIQAHAFWRLKGLTVDLVIWNEDHGGYRQGLQNQILSMIAPIHQTDEPVKPGGIFVRSAEQLSNEDRILFQTVARVIISDKLGTLEGQLNRRKWLKPVLQAFTPTAGHSRLESKIKRPADLQFFNDLGGFTKDGREYCILTSPDRATPAPWSNVIANPDFGTVISESGQAYTWFKNAHELRLTPWHNDPVTDAGGEYFYVRDEITGDFWSPVPLPATGTTPYITRHGFGYSIFEHMEDGIHSEITVYVDPVLPIKYTYFKFRNRSGEARQLSLTGYVEWVLGDLRHKTMMHIITGLDHHSGAILAHNSYLTEFGQLAAFFDTNEASRMITTDRVEFIGRHGTARKPLGMLKSKLSGKTGAALDPCGVIQVHFQLAEDGEYEVLFRMGAGMQIQEVERYAREGRNRARAREVLESLKQEWKTNLSAIEIDSPDDALNFLTNGWLNYQTIACRLWARSGYYQSGGAFGFRDQLQDVMSILHTQPAWARDQILLAASRQFKQGDVQHWWHPPGGRGVRTRCSDDYLWLPHVASKYVMVTGDTGIWDEKISFLESRELNPHEHSFYDLPVQSGIQGTLYDHCIKALDNGLRFGQHGLPLIGSGDWNDGMDRVGIEGNGESTWLGWFLFDTLQKFIEAIGLKAEQNKINHYREVMDMLRKNLNTQAWDGQWYRRAYFDDGTPLGSKSNPECQIDSIAQSWAVLSGAGDATKTRSAMQEAFDMLVRKNDKIIQLLDPPFNISDPNPGYIKGYVPGVRENGGQYTHAALWMIMAYCVMRDKVKMWELLDMVNPIHHGSTKKEVSVYKVEPYVMAGDLYTESLHIGRGGWTWYTGSAGWMYQLITEYVLGLHRKGETLVISPCLPLHWDKVTVRYRYGRAVYIIDLIQVSAETDSLSTVVDDVESVDNIIHLVDDGREHAVEVNIGEAVKIG